MTPFQRYLPELTVFALLFAGAVVGMAMGWGHL